VVEKTKVKDLLCDGVKPRVGIAISTLLSLVFASFLFIVFGTLSFWLRKGYPILALARSDKLSTNNIYHWRICVISLKTMACVIIGTLKQAQ